MKKLLSVLVALGLASFAFAADGNKTEAKAEKKAEKKAKKAKAEKKEENKTK